MKNLYNEANIINFKISDHKLIEITINYQIHIKWGKGVWKLNNTLLNNNEYNNEIKQLLQKNLMEEDKDIIMTWDTIKSKVKKISINYSKRLQELKRKEKNEISQMLQNATGKFSENLEEKLSKIREEEEKGPEIRAGKFSELYQTARGLAKREEFRKREEKLLLSIKDNKNKKHTEKRELMTIIKEYYQDLYKTQNIEYTKINEYLENTTCKKNSIRT